MDCPSHADDELLFAVHVDAEGHGVAAPHPRQIAEGPLDVARVIVAAADDDHVLHAAAREEAVAHEVPEVARVAATGASAGSPASGFVRLRP